MSTLRVKLSHEVQSSKQWRLDLKGKKSPSCFTIILSTAECQQRSWNTVILTRLTCSTSVPNVLHQKNYLVPQLNPYQSHWGLCHSHFRKKEGYCELFFKNWITLGSNCKLLLLLFITCITDKVCMIWMLSNLPCTESWVHAGQYITRSLYEEEYIRKCQLYC